VLAVTEVPQEGRALITNGHFMSDTSWLSQRYMRAFAHIPLLSMPAPARVLVICFGVGNTVHAATLHPSVTRVDVVDTSRHVLEHARYFEGANGGVLAHPKVAVHVNDGRHHLRMQPPAAYDLITLEPPPIPFAGVASLYSREFYALARSRLTSGGYLTQWLPAYQTPHDVTLAMVRAFVDVFPHAVLLSGMKSELILVGVNDGHPEIDPARVRARLDAAPAVRADLARVSLGSLTEIVGTFAGSAEALAAATEPYRPVTDDNPLTEYAIASRLSDHEIPLGLFSVTAVETWCPRCLADGRPVAELEDLPRYLEMFARLYQHPAFRVHSWPHPAPEQSRGMAVPSDAATVRLIAASPYLQTVFRGSERGGPSVVGR
jgi:spermidine synthase